MEAHILKSSRGADVEPEFIDPNKRSAFALTGDDIGIALYARQPGENF